MEREEFTKVMQKGSTRWRESVQVSGENPMSRISEDAEIIDVGLISPECIDRVVSFIPVLNSLSPENIADWPKPEKNDDGVLVLALAPNYDSAVEAVMKSLYENHFVQPFDWGEWQPTAQRIFSDPGRLSRATLKTCIKLITLHSRKDRFCGGHFGEMVRSGHIVAILHRLAGLRKSVEVRSRPNGRP